jgi:Rad3-related DNA helicase
MKSPADIGMPHKFKSWRPGQEQAVKDFLTCESRHLLQIMPTGVGKSLIYMTGAVKRCEPTVILTSTKGLQDQLVNDFSAVGLVELKGRKNYRCIRGDGPTCEDGLCHYGIECQFKAGGCSYFDALRGAKQARYVVTNYAMWLTAGEFIREGRQTLIMDEAHAAPDHLSDFLAVEVDLGFISVALGETVCTPRNWPEWARVLLIRVNNALEEGLLNPDLNLHRLRQLSRVKRTLESIVLISASPLVVDKVGEKHIINPLCLIRYAEPSLFMGIPHIQLTSATVTAHTARMLGIKDHAVEEYPSPFKVEHRPVVWVPTAKVDRNMDHGAEMLWLSRIDQIVGTRLDRKGIVHTVSYERARRVVSDCKCGRFAVVHGPNDTALKVAAFKRRKAPALLVSPSMTTGWDFPYDQCRWQIIAKIPFPDSRPAIQQARQQVDPSLPFYMAWQTLVQEAGRGVRAEDDWCETIIIDDNFRWLLANYSHLAPRWFLAAVKKSSMIPKPM